MRKSPSTYCKSPIWPIQTKPSLHWSVKYRNSTIARRFKQLWHREISISYHIIAFKMCSSASGTTNSIRTLHHSKYKSRYILVFIFTFHWYKVLCDISDLSDWVTQNLKKMKKFFFLFFFKIKSNKAEFKQNLTEYFWNNIRSN